MLSPLPLLRSLSFALLLLASPLYAAEEPIKEPSVSFVRHHETQIIREDGAATITYERAIKVLRESAIDDVKSTSISYSTSVEKGEIIKAYTQKPDGRIIEVPKSNYQLEVNSAKDKGIAPAFSDYTTLSIVFPEVAVNDTLVLQYKITQSEPMFPNQFSDYSAYYRSRIYDEASVTYDFPASMPLRFHVYGLTPKAPIEKDGRITKTWTYQNKTAIKDKRSGSSVFKYGDDPSILASTFPSYAALAEAYGQRARPKAVVTERIQKLADEITKGKTAPRDQAAALYDWVRKNMSFAGNCIGVGAVVPRDPAFVLDNKMGDCKDHATLLQALLKAKGIASTQALISAGSAFELPPIPIISAVNHVINYIPSLDLYADATASTYPLGVLPAAIASKPVLLVDGYKDGIRTHARPKKFSGQKTVSTITIKEDGAATGTVEVLMTGDYGLNAFNSFKDKTPEQEAEFLKNLPKRYRLDGTATLNRNDPENKPERMKYVFGFDVKKYIEVGQAGGMAIAPLFAPPLIHHYVAGNHADEPTPHDFSCSDGLIEESYTLNFPKNTQILAIPENMSFKNDLITYEATYAQKENSVTIRRLYDDNTVGPVCSPAVAAAYKAAAEKILPNLKAQIVYK